MSSLVIVAIPREDDLVWKISSEKKPHMTILFLGDADNPNRSQMAGYLHHCITMQVISRFGLGVDRRGTLGEDQADVIFFDKEDWAFPRVRDFRNVLLQDPNIKSAYDSVEQFPEWTPHLTLGYPEAPAKKMDEHERFYYVDFDRVALWEGNFEGVEFILKREVYMDSEVAMGDLAQAGQDFLSHYGVKGMRWGVRNERTAQDVIASTGRKKLTGKTKVETKGGENHPASKDAIKAATAKRKLKKSGVAALSDQELRDVIARTQLETQAQQAVASGGSKFLKRQASSTRDQQAQAFISDIVSPKRRKITGA